jgi:hypothetical protein
VPDFLNGLDAPKSIVGALIVVLLMLLGAGIRRYDRGSDQVVTGLGGLNDRLVADAVAARAEAQAERIRADAAERVSGAQAVLIGRMQEYVHGLEEDSGRPHREWKVEVGDL